MHHVWLIAAGRPQHGPGGVRERGGPEEVYLGEGEHQLPLLQRVLRLRLPHGTLHALRQDHHAYGKTGGSWTIHMGTI